MLITPNEKSRISSGYRRPDYLTASHVTERGRIFLRGKPLPKNSLTVVYKRIIRPRFPERPYTIDIRKPYGQGVSYFPQISQGSVALSGNVPPALSKAVIPAKFTRPPSDCPCTASALRALGHVTTPWNAVTSDYDSLRDERKFLLPISYLDVLSFAGKVPGREVFVPPIDLQDVPSDNDTDSDVDDCIETVNVRNPGVTVGKEVSSMLLYDVPL